MKSTSRQLAFALMAMVSTSQAFSTFFTGMIPKSAPSKTQIVDRAEQFMNTAQGYFNPIDETYFADDFVFRGPIIGPLNKEDYKEVLEYFKIYEALPDISPNCFGFSVDPEDPYRVWFLMRSTGTYQKQIGGFLGKIASVVSPPDGRQHRGSTETWSLTFNDKLQVRAMTAGYVADRFEEDATTDGRGLSFGILSTIGLPLPTTPGGVVTRGVQQVAEFIPRGIFPKSASDPEKVPSWWKSTKRGADA